MFTTLTAISNEIATFTFNLLSSKSRGYQCTKFVVSSTKGFKTLINATTKNIGAKRLIYGPSDHLFCKINISKNMIWGKSKIMHLVDFIKMVTISKGLA